MARVTKQEALDAGFSSVFACALSQMLCIEKERKGLAIQGVVTIQGGQMAIKWEKLG